MKAYFIRRLLLIPPTLIGITLLVFVVTRFMPGGPMERDLQAAAQKGSDGGRSKSDRSAGNGLSEEQLEELEERYGYDKPILYAYLQWLGLLPREAEITKGEFGGEAEERIGGALDAENTVLLVLRGDGRLVKVTRSGEQIDSAVFVESNTPVATEGWQLRYENETTRQERFTRRNGSDQKVPGYPPRVVVYKVKFAGVLQGDFGNSFTYGDKVTTMMASRVPVAVYFGLLSAMITYGVCLPLGILKAIRHRTFVDSLSSVLIFVGYAIPGFALGALMLVHLGARHGWFPMFGLTSPEFPEMSSWDQLKDLAHHTVLPLICYVAGGFAFLTMLMKNSLMENMAADYVRTAVSKGVGFGGAVFGHAFRNSFIPIATSLGHLITVFVGGSMLIEQVFDIQGFGLLQYHAVIDRDVPLIMGTLSIAALLMLLGNVLSDLIVAMVDPRIKFN
jgi:microcin C transport system permease protein